MANYPGSFEFKIYFEASNLHEICQLCLPISEEVGFSIYTWEIPPDSIPQSEGLEEKLVELKTQEDRGDEDVAYVSHFNLDEDSNLILSLCYYDNRKLYCAGQCNLYMYVREDNTVEEIQDFVDRALNFCRQIIKKKDVNRFFLYRGASGYPYIPNAPLVENDYQIVFVTPEEVEQNYDDSEVFWNYPWDSKEQHGDRYLLTRCLDMTKYVEDGAYHAAILEPHWNLIRAAKPGTIKYFRPYPEPDEKDIFNKGEPSLNLVGYFEDSLTLKYTCHLEPDQHIRGWEIFEIYLQLKKKQTKDEKELQQIQVVFDDRKTAQRELRPLLEAGAKVIYTNEDGQEIDLEKAEKLEQELESDRQKLTQLRSQLKKVEERIKQARKTNIFNRPQSGENEREKDRLTQEIQQAKDRIAKNESERQSFY